MRLPWGFYSSLFVMGQMVNVVLVELTDFSCHISLLYRLNKQTYWIFAVLFLSSRRITAIPNGSAIHLRTQAVNSLEYNNRKPKSIQKKQLTATPMDFNYLKLQSVMGFGFLAFMPVSVDVGDTNVRWC